MSKTITKLFTENLLVAEGENEKMNEINVYPFEPSQHTINNILNFSKALSVRGSKHMTAIEMVLN